MNPQLDKRGCHGLDFVAELSDEGFHPCAGRSRCIATASLLLEIVRDVARSILFIAKALWITEKEYDDTQVNVPRSEPVTR